MQSMTKQKTAQTITLSQFERLCKERTPDYFTYIPGQQIKKELFCKKECSGPHYVNNNNGKLPCHYAIMTVFLSPNVIVFHDCNATTPEHRPTLYFRYVEHINIIEESPATGIVFDIVCRESAFTESRRTHRLFAKFSQRGLQR